MFLNFLLLILIYDYDNNNTRRSFRFHPILYRKTTVWLATAIKRTCQSIFRTTPCKCIEQHSNANFSATQLTNNNENIALKSTRDAKVYAEEMALKNLLPESHETIDVNKKVSFFFTFSTGNKLLKALNKFWNGNKFSNKNNSLSDQLKFNGKNGKEIGEDPTQTIRYRTIGYAIQQRSNHSLEPGVGPILSYYSTPFYSQKCWILLQQFEQKFINVHVTFRYQ